MIIAWATAIYDSVKPKAWRAHIKMATEMARWRCSWQRFEDRELWILQTMQDRLTYPFCVYFHVESMLQTEKAYGKKADWFFWIEDDVIPEPDCCFKLIEAADPETRPFVSALVYTRVPPYWPGIATLKKDEESNLAYREQWATAPKTGTIPVDRVGMGACVIHRSLFDRIPEPWFRIVAPDSAGKGMGPDTAWCLTLKENGIQPYVCCDVEVGHLSDNVVINRETSEAWNKNRKRLGPGPIKTT